MKTLTYKKCLSIDWGRNSCSHIKRNIVPKTKILNTLTFTNSQKSSNWFIKTPTSFLEFGKLYKRVLGKKWGYKVWSCYFLKPPVSQKQSSIKFLWSMVTEAGFHPDKLFNLFWILTSDLWAWGENFTIALSSRAYHTVLCLQARTSRVSRKSEDVRFWKLSLKINLKFACLGGMLSRIGTAV